MKFTHLEDVHLRVFLFNTTITSTIIVYAHSQDNFFIALIENWFYDDEVVFQSDNTFCHRSKGCYGDISYHTPKMNSSNLNIFSELARSG